MRESPAPGRLVSVRLTDVPAEVRLRAAAGMRMARFDEQTEERPEDRLFAKLVGGGQDELFDAARDPSSRVYWITERAYRAVLG